MNIRSHDIRVDSEKDSPTVFAATGDRPKYAVDSSRLAAAIRAVEGSAAKGR